MRLLFLNLRRTLSQMTAMSYPGIKINAGCGGLVNVHKSLLLGFGALQDEGRLVTPRTSLGKALDTLLPVPYHVQHQTLYNKCRVDYKSIKSHD